MKKLVLLFCLALFFPVLVHAQVYQMDDGTRELELPAGWQVDEQKAKDAKTDFYAEQNDGKISLFAERIVFPDELVAQNFQSYSDGQRETLMKEVGRNIILGNLKAMIVSQEFVKVGEETVLLANAQDGSVKGKNTVLVQALFLKEAEFYQLSFLTDEYNSEMQKEIEAIIGSFT